MAETHAGGVTERGAGIDDEEAMSEMGEMRRGLK